MSELESFGLKAPQKNGKSKWQRIAIIFLVIFITFAIIVSSMDNITSAELKRRATQIYEQLEEGANYHYTYKRTIEETETIYDVQKDRNQSYYMQVTADSLESSIEIYIIDQQAYIISDDMYLVLEDINVNAQTIDDELIYGPLFANLKDVLETVYSGESISEDNDKYIHSVDIIGDGGLELKIGEETSHIYKETDQIEYYYQPVNDDSDSTYEQIEITEVAEIEIPEVEVE